MEKEFIPYEQALALKELGFDKPCFGVFDYCDILHFGKIYYYLDIKEPSYLAPTFSQAFRWFREKYKISGEISSDYYLEGKDNEWEYNIYQLGKEDDGYVGTTPIFKTPEDAELACLKKLIEIVKEK